MDWIDVNERLPEEGQLVLAHCGRMLGIQVVQLINYSLPWGKKKMIWQSIFTNRQDIKVTHWMPLPEPPTA